MARQSLALQSQLGPMCINRADKKEMDLVSDRKGDN